MTQTLYLKQLQCGPMQNYVYLIGDPATRQAAVVDPAWEIERIVQAAQAGDYTMPASSRRSRQSFPTAWPSRSNGSPTTRSGARCGRKPSLTSIKLA